MSSTFLCPALSVRVSCEPFTIYPAHAPSTTPSPVPLEVVLLGSQPRTFYSCSKVRQRPPPRRAQHPCRSRLRHTTLHDRTTPTVSTHLYRPLLLRPPFPSSIPVSPRSVSKWYTSTHTLSLTSLVTSPQTKPSLRLERPCSDLHSPDDVPDPDVPVSPASWVLCK